MTHEIHEQDHYSTRKKESVIPDYIGLLGLLINQTNKITKGHNNLKSTLLITRESFVFGAEGI